MSKLDLICSSIGLPDEAAANAARSRQDRLTKPPGSLGRLEELAVRVAAIQGTSRPEVADKAVFVLAADHGVAREGVSAYPQAVTAQMVYNFVRGGAAINVLARHIGTRVIVADLGVACDLEPHPQIVVKKIGYGTRSLACGPAMRREEARRSIEAGIEIFEAELKQGLQLVGTGDMGIGNTTAATAIAAACCGLPVEQVVGRGTGIDDARFTAKIAVITRSLEMNRPEASDPIDVLAKVGGYEIGGLAGVILAAAAHRVPVVIDGFISGAAALIAVGLEPKVKEFIIAGHVSKEPGHRRILERMGLQPLLDLEMRLGEGTGAVLAMGIVEAAVKLLNEMATFDEAGVAEAIDQDQTA